MVDANIVICGRYELSAKIPSPPSSKYIFFTGYNLHSKQKLFIKAEERLRNSIEDFAIVKQSKNYQIIQGGPGIPSLSWCGQDGDFNFLVIEHLKKQNLENIFESHKKSFTLKTIIQIGLQTLESIHYMHTKGLVYNNVHPFHILPGLGRNNHKLYFVDYSLCANYKNGSQEEINKKLVHSNNLFSSLNIALGGKCSKMDDIESWFYLLVYLVLGELPWMNCKNKNTNTVRRRKKQCIQGGLLLKRLQIEELKCMLKYIRSAECNQRPDYQYLKNLLQKAALRQYIILDNVFDWTLSANGRLLDETFPQELIFNAPLVQNQNQFLDEQYQLYTQEIDHLNNISNLLSQTLNNSDSVEEAPMPESLPEPCFYKQNCILF